ncbi:MAG: hypothetical protein ABIG56_00530 [Candidatus Omnitrophota bacterium]
MNKIFNRLAIFLLIAYSLQLRAVVFAAQEADLKFSLDIEADTVFLPKIFRPNIDLSGRGFHRKNSWPQTLADGTVLENWENDIGFKGIYRLQFSLWEIEKLSGKEDEQQILLTNYERIIKKISDAGGIVILNLFGTPDGLGRVLDKKSPLRDLREFKRMVKGYIKELSCNKRYNIWYEVWNAPDLDDFFLGRRQDYFNLYRMVAESIKELRTETKIFIPLGGPSVSWWFQSIDGNTIITPERGMIYELIQYCYRYRLPLDFISWHTFSTSPDSEEEITGYKKNVVSLIREWLTYFKFDPNTPLIIDEWNFDAGANISPERGEKSYICSSFIPARIKNMYKSGIDYQTYFSLEDFQENKEGVARNTGIFYFDPESSKYKGGEKAVYNAYKMLSFLGRDMFLTKFKDDFVGAIATREKGRVILLLYNYIDPNTAMNYLAKHIATLGAGDRERLLRFIKSERFEKFLRGELEVSGSKRLRKRVKVMLEKARVLNNRAILLAQEPRKITVEIKNLKGNYLYEKYVVDSSCRLDCPFNPVGKKEVITSDIYQETFTMNPYSLNMIILDSKPIEVQKEQGLEQPAAEAAEAAEATEKTTLIEQEQEVEQSE